MQLRFIIFINFSANKIYKSRDFTKMNFKNYLQTNYDFFKLYFSISRFSGIFQMFSFPIL